MSQIISVDNVTKMYRLGAIGGATLQEDVSRWWARVRRQSDPTALVGQTRARQTGDEFMALNGISFSVDSGEVLGIIGRNGAGKSTLLKILSQVTGPTTGSITLRGRVASLLEVGTGFHPDLTGRENVFLNGAIMGMTKSEIRRRFDEIVEFSECQQFIDTPVKRYSSGMYVRLAFAVAAHLEPEILIVDEVLAVGDAQFQRKCLGKMQTVGREGRTVLFVSHTMSAITRLCSKALLLGGGQIVAHGAVQDVVAEYLNSGHGTTTVRDWPDIATAPGDDVVRLTKVAATAEGEGSSSSFDIRKPIQIDVEYEVIKSGVVLSPNIHVNNGEGVCVFISHDWDPEWRRQPRPVGRYRSTCTIPGNLLAEGTFIIGASIGTYRPFIVRALVQDVIAFEVQDTADGDSARGDYAGRLPGIVRPKLPWTTVQTASSVEV